MYNEKQRNEIFERIFDLIEDGNSLRKALKEVNLSSKSFYDWIDKDELKIKQYARACEERAEALLDEMIDIVDDGSQDVIIDKENGYEKTNSEAIQRSRLRYDARKWLISKLNPKKYGDKIDVTTDNKPINNSVRVEIVRPDESDNSI